jgi:uncharacterized protein (DUF1330 family)
MPKGYWIARVDVTDADAYKRYVAANSNAFAKYGARFLVRGGSFKSVEGGSRARNVVLEFPSYEAAIDCYRSPEYAEALEHRRGAGEADILIIEGYDGVQPGAG